MECSCKLCPSPGIYAVTSIPFVNRTRATFLSAEFGFFGVVVYTRVQTPLFCGLPSIAGALLFQVTPFRLFRTSWFIVGKQYSVCLLLPGPSKKLDKVQKRGQTVKKLCTQQPEKSFKSCRPIGRSKPKLRSLSHGSSTSFRRFPLKLLLRQQPHPLSRRRCL